jgi:prepilin-type N-terminal cleavage/methylation domain-containing protein
MSSPPIAVERRRTAGFALLEVLVAVAVAAVIMTALMRAFATTWTGIAAVREEVESMMVARAVLSATGPRSNLVDTTQNGVLGAYAWSLSISEAPLPGAPAPAPNPDGGNAQPWKLYRILVVITAPNGRSTSLDTLRLGRPAS